MDYPRDIKGGHQREDKVADNLQKHYDLIASINELAHVPVALATAKTDLTKAQRLLVRRQSSQKALEVQQ
jgi:hypothetical protein